VRRVLEKPMKSIVSLCAGAAAALLFTAPVQAHHSFPATYEIDKTVKIQGKVVQFMFRNPHSVIHVLAPDETGKEVRWAVEWAAAGALQRDGVATREILRPGDIVIISGAPGRNPADHKIRLNLIERPADGWKWGGSFD
jgi:hypothetical protein